MRIKEDKSLFLNYLKEYPSIVNAGKKAGIARSTIYRWMKDNPDFKKKVNASINEGRINSSEIIESRLFALAMKGSFQAIKYYLEHNSPRYRPRLREQPIPAKETLDPGELCLQCGEKKPEKPDPASENRVREFMDKMARFYYRHKSDYPDEPPIIFQSTRRSSSP